MLIILASYAEEGSRSVSENQKWRVRKNFAEGIPWNGTVLGYRYKSGGLVPVPEEAEIVRFIYSEFLSGKGTTAIAKGLNNRGVPMRKGKEFSKSGIGHILRNYTYTGNLLLQTYRTKRTLVNHGELPMYHAENTNPAIIDMASIHCGTSRDTAPRRTVSSCRPGAKDIPLYGHHHLRQVRETLPPENNHYRAGLDLRHLQRFGEKPLRFKADSRSDALCGH